MGFFNLFGNTNDNSGTPSSPDSSNEPIVLQYNDEEITFTQAEAEGLTLRQLFARAQDDLGIDSASIERFVSAGSIVSGESVPRAGTVYRAAGATGEKG